MIPDKNLPYFIPKTHNGRLSRPTSGAFSVLGGVRCREISSLTRKRRKRWGVFTHETLAIASREKKNTTSRGYADKHENTP